MATFTKPTFFMKVVWKLFQFKKILDVRGLKLSVNLGVYLHDSIIL